MYLNYLGICTRSELQILQVRAREKWPGSRHMFECLKSELTVPRHRCSRAVIHRLSFADLRAAYAGQHGVRWSRLCLPFSESRHQVLSPNVLASGLVIYYLDIMRLSIPGLFCGLLKGKVANLLRCQCLSLILDRYNNRQTPVQVKIRARTQPQIPNHIPPLP